MENPRPDTHVMYEDWHSLLPEVLKAIPRETWDLRARRGKWAQGHRIDGGKSPAIYAKAEILAFARQRYAVTFPDFIAALEQAGYGK